MPTASEDWVVRFDRVSKRFHRQEGRTLREFVPGLLRGDAWAPAFDALHDVSFSVRRGESVGILGRNGSGKTTILRLIGGVMTPASGHVWVRGRVSPLLELGAGFHPDLTGGENVFLNASVLGMTNEEARSRFEAIIDFAELWDFLDMPVKRYSSGMYLRLAFAIAVHSDPDILLIDDAFAVGDVPFQAKCFERLVSFQRRGVTIVLVSHVPDLLRHFCHQVLLLDAGCLVAAGNADTVLERYQSIAARPVEPASEALAARKVGVKRSSKEGLMSMRHVIAMLASVVCGLGVVSAESTGTPAETVENTMARAVEPWLALWDAGNYDDVYAQLASVTQAGVSKAKWLEYANAVRKPLGKLKSRQLIRRGGDEKAAMLQYQSSFEAKPSVLETVGVVREKDGGWRVANYTAQ